jgi:hypothetical protein
MLTGIARRVGYKSPDVTRTNLASTRYLLEAL